MIKERVTVDFDSESYYLDGEYWESWDHYGEQMADSINKLLDKQDKLIRAKNQQLEDVKRILTNHKEDISYMEVGQCTTARLELIEQILIELGWD